MTELTGRVLQNRYRVDAFLGRGGMADVYKVWDQQRAVYLAMKILHADLAEDRVFLRRFKREADTLAKLQHPHIVRSYGLETEGRIAFLLMDYIEGENLRTRIFDRNRPFTPEEILEIMRPVFSALHYAHQNGIVHCDIKPANIMIHKSGNVLVSDFGISRITEAATATMVGAGTPAYMSPEQARGEDMTPQSDIYSLGIVLYEMLSGGERPFTGEQARVTGGTSEKVRWEQMNAVPQPLRKMNPEISVAVEAVVMSFLQKDSAYRPASALDALNALAQVLDSVRTAPLPVNIPQSQPAHQPIAENIPAEKPNTSSRSLPVNKTKSAMLIAGVVISVICALLFGVFSLVSNNQFFASIGAPPTPLPSRTPVPATSTSTRLPISTKTLTKTLTPRPKATSTKKPTATSALVALSNTIMARIKEIVANSVSSLDITDASLIYGPVSGSLEQLSYDYVDTLNTDIYVKNFIVTATFENPGTQWDYGFFFRDTYKEAGAFWFTILSDKTWSLNLSKPTEWISVRNNQSRYLTSLKGEKNFVVIIVIDTNAYIFINDSLDRQVKLIQTEAGSISLATGMWYGNSDSGTYIKYEEFTIWSLP